MSKANATARRVRVERNIYRRQDASGHTVHEVGYRDSAGRQRWRTVDGGITAARAARDDVRMLVAYRASGALVPSAFRELPAFLAG